MTKLDHLSELFKLLSTFLRKKLAKVSGNKKVSMIPQKNLQKNNRLHSRGKIILSAFVKKHNFPIFIDNRALEMGTMIVSAGEVGAQSASIAKPWQILSVQALLTYATTHTNNGLD